MYTDVYNPKSRLTLYLKWLSTVTLSNESGNDIPDNARLEYEYIILNSPILTTRKYYFCGYRSKTLTIMVYIFIIH